MNGTLGIAIPGAFVIATGGSQPLHPHEGEQQYLVTACGRIQGDVAMKRRSQRAVHNKMVAQLKEGKQNPEVLAWAKDQLEGFAR
jgi:hypothetical protein